MFCTECGVKNPADSKFCRQCGHKMDRARISEEAYTQALPDDEQTVELLESAYALRKKNDLTGAVAACERALQIAPDSAAAHSLLGQLCAAQGNRERAIREYEQVLRLNPGSIADRVKLDELRDEGLPKAARTASALVAAGRENAAPSILTLVSIGAAALALIGAGVAMSRSHPASGLNNGGVSNANSGSVSRVAGVVTPPNPATTSGYTATEIAAPPTDAEKPGALLVNPATVHSASNAANTAPNAAPTVTRNLSPFAVAAPTVTLPAINSANSPAPAVSAAKSKPKQPAAPKPTAPPTDNRIVLNSNEAGSSDGGRYVININAGGAGKVSGGFGKNSVVIGKNSGAAENPPASDSRSAISVADDLRYKGEFDKAVQMYQRALPGAGDRVAHVYHQMAYCFQSKGDRSSAKVNYERAIVAYQRLAASGHEAEAAQSAIRVCQRGLKICE